MKNHETDTTASIQRLMQTANGFRTAILLLTANHDGLFDLLAGKPAPAPKIADTLGWDTRAAGIFLNALTGMGFLQKSGDRYSNADIAAQLLVKSSPQYQGDILKHNQNLLEQRWIHLPEVLKTGKPVGAPVVGQSGERLRNFIAGMANSAKLMAGTLWEQVDLKGRKRLLDVGGGPGSFAFEACRLVPGLEAVVFDLPDVEPIFNEFRDQSEAGIRVTFHAGDYLETPLPEGFDVALLSNIIHSLGEDENLQLLGKISEALLPGGLLIVKDFFVSADGTQPLWTALFAVNMLVGTESGTTYSKEEVERWLVQTGFKVSRYFDMTEQTGVLIATRQ